MSEIPYESAYTGISRDSLGSFDYFTIEVGDKHQQDGYWRFNDLTDQKRAFLRGIHSPEELLHAIMLGEDAGEDIALLWIPGQRDEGRKTQIKATAGEHLTDVNVIREYLGFPPVHEEQIPVYPIDARLRAFWERRDAQKIEQQIQKAPKLRKGPTRRDKNVDSTSALEFVVHLPRDEYDTLIGQNDYHGPAPEGEASPVHTHEVHNGPDNRTALDYISEDTQSKYTQPVPPPPGFVAHDPDTTRRTGIETTERSDGSRCKKCIKAHKKCNRQRPCQNCKVTHDCVSEDEDNKNRRLKNKQPVAKKAAKVSKATKIPRSLRSSDVTKAQEGDKTAHKDEAERQEQRPITKEGILISYESVIDLESEACSLPQKSGASVSEQAKLPATTSTQSTAPSAWRMSDKPDSFHLDKAMRLSTPSSQQSVPSTWHGPKRLEPLHAEQAAPSALSSRQRRMSLAQRVGNTDKEPRQYQSPYLSLHHSSAGEDPQDRVMVDTDPVSATSLMPSSGLPKDAVIDPTIPDNPTSTSNSVFEPALVELQAKDCDVGESIRPDDIPETVSQAAADDVESMKMVSDVDPTFTAPTIDAGLPQEDTMVADVHDTIDEIDMRESSTLADESETEMEVVGVTLEMTLDLPCMECGWDVGHSWDCHIGNIKPMEHLTSRDICKFAIMAEKFDPDNSIRMYDYAVPGFEDPETQISRMADHIRNEENYKNDAALHSVPDGLMVLLWALKTSEKIDVAPNPCEIGSEDQPERPDPISTLPMRCTSSSVTSPGVSF